MQLVSVYRQVFGQQCFGKRSVLDHGITVCCVLAQEIGIWMQSSFCMSLACETVTTKWEKYFGFPVVWT